MIPYKYGITSVAVVVDVVAMAVAVALADAVLVVSAVVAELSTSQI